jgi:hypothetical protein
VARSSRSPQGGPVRCISHLSVRLCAKRPFIGSLVMSPPRWPSVEARTRATAGLYSGLARTSDGHRSRVSRAHFIGAARSCRAAHSGAVREALGQVEKSDFTDAETIDPDAYAVRPTIPVSFAVWVSVGSRCLGAHGRFAECPFCESCIRGFADRSPISMLLVDSFHAGDTSAIRCTLDGRVQVSRSHGYGVHKTSGWQAVWGA